MGMGISRAIACVVVALALFETSVARANPEPSSTYDARVAGMAGAAIGYIDNATAIFHNPAGLAHIPRWSGTLVVDLLVVKYNVPFAGPGSEIDSPPIFAPLPFLGVAGRLGRRFVLGAAVYITTGFGGRFTNIPRLDDYTPRTQVECANAPIGSTCNNTMPPTTVTQGTDSQTVNLFVVEAAASLGVEVTPKLRLGLSLRLPYTHQSASAIQETQPGGMAPWQEVSQTVAGLGLPGILIGTQWDATRFMTLALVYRSPTTSNMSGETKTRLTDSPEPITVQSSSEWKTPHMIRVGATFRALHDRLMVNLELRAQFHRQANHDQRFELCYPNCETNVLSALGVGEIVAPFEWRNVVYPTFGAQYQIASNMWWRFGTSVGRAATPRSTVSPFSPPPGWQYNLATGFGVAVGSRSRVRLDFAYAFGLGPSAVISQRNAVNCSTISQQKSGCDGTYSLDSHTFAFSMTYTR